MALEELARQQNVPSLLLIDAARFYKKGHTARQEVAAAVKSQQTDITEMRRQIDTLVKDGRTHQKRLDKVEDCITVATDDLGSVCEDIDTLRQDTLRTNDVATRNNQDIGKLAERFDKLERDLTGSVCEDIDALRQYTLGISDVTTRNNQDVGELAERFEKLERDVAALRESEKHNAEFRSQMQALVLGSSLPHSGILEHSGGPRSHGPVLDSLKGTGDHMVGRSLHGKS
jgi:chromosome segregation ATPase